MENEKKPSRSEDIKQAYRTAYLIAGFLKHTLTEEEKEELDAWIIASNDNMILFEKMTDERNIEQAADWFNRMNVDAELSNTKRKIKEVQPVRFWSYAIAAAILLIIVGLFLLQNNNSDKSKTLAKDKQDILPGAHTATLVLDNGQRIILGNTGADTIVNSQIKISRKDGLISYSADSLRNQLVYNTLVVPKKGSYKLVLPDGSKVWLNAASSIRFPVAFTGAERKVFITGEAFFEVAKDKAKPFRVIANDVMVEALGTRFNVNVYNNEPVYSATLLEGLIKVKSGLRENILHPGEEAEISGSGFYVTKANADAEAWINNEFKFDGTSLYEIMRQVERWYDADVNYKDSVDLHLNATISRNVPVSNLLQILAATEQVHFKIQNNTIAVMK